ncbi:hypothetical protein TSOC_004854 [Tetrabaena socialis]|uniref:Uncharacterized protein n=1 Tax=Tetrabaena socialis TaxID=47790 RepID=A0A2J8A7W1_9CHLO|nr:hypothetical protein TSOC_004854 [Tetrabaena socialis]|eukprot:PNH08601.1 hypothetical protein TSOC_004854 [Tetrabaena socialis]
MGSAQGLPASRVEPHGPAYHSSQPLRQLLDVGGGGHRHAIPASLRPGRCPPASQQPLLTQYRTYPPTSARPAALSTSSMRMTGKDQSSTSCHSGQESGTMAKTEASTGM